MKNRIISVLLALVIALSLFPVCAFAEGYESEPLPPDESIMEAAENMQPINDLAAIERILAACQSTSKDSTAPSRAERAVLRSSNYCNLFHVANRVKKYGEFNFGNYSLSFSFADDPIYDDISIIYSPNEAKLYFFILESYSSAYPEFSNILATLTFDLTLGKLVDNEASFGCVYRDNYYDGHIYFDPSTITEDSVLTLYTGIPSSMGPAYADVAADLLKIGIIYWNAIMYSYADLTIGDIGFISYFEPTGNIVSSHNFRNVSSYGGVTSYACSWCGLRVTSFFDDVSPYDFYLFPVNWAVDNGITTGTSHYNFSPNSPCTRGQVVTFLWRAAGCPMPRNPRNPFNDISSSKYYYTAVLWAVENNITTGVGGGRFAPNQTCTRGQVVTFLHRFFGCQKVEEYNFFYDVSPKNFFYDAVTWAVAYDITKGTGNGIFSPNQPCSRGQIVTFLYRAFMWL